VTENNLVTANSSVVSTVELREWKDNNVANVSSTRFIIFDKHAKIITEHQTEFPQILPHAGWHEQDPMDLVDSMKECINQAVEKLEWMGWHRDSVKGIGGSRQDSSLLSA
jgi:glycerol kinase